MIKTRIIVRLLRNIIVIITLLSTVVFSEEKMVFPQFTQQYWVEAGKSADGKNIRGIGATITGLGTLPIAIPLALRVEDNPGKYYGLTLMSIIASCSFTGHGIGSILFAREETNAANEYIAAFKKKQSNIFMVQQQKFYLYQSRKNKVKTGIFSDLLITLGSIALGSGLSQYAIEKSNPEAYTYKPIRPTLIGSGLIFIGVVGKIQSIRSRKEIETFLFKNAEYYLPNSSFTEGNRSNPTRLQWKKRIGIASVSTGSLLTGLSFWQLGKMYSSSYMKEDTWYYDPNYAVPFYVSTFAGGVAMVLYGVNAIKSAHIFQKHAGDIVNTQSQTRSLPASFNVYYYKKTFGLHYRREF